MEKVANAERPITMDKAAMMRRTFIMQATAFLIMLSIQFILGIATNLFIKLPSAGGAEAWRAAWTNAVVILHMIIGLGLFVGSIFFMIRTIVARDRRWMITTLIGFIGMLLAFFGGVLFVQTQSDAYSFIMAIGFILGVLAYGWGLVRR